MYKVNDVVRLKDDEHTRYVIMECLESSYKMRLMHDWSDTILPKEYHDDELIYVTSLNRGQDKEAQRLQEFRDFAGDSVIDVEFCRSYIRELIRERLVVNPANVLNSVTLSTLTAIVLDKDTSMISKMLDDDKLQRLYYNDVVMRKVYAYVRDNYDLFLK